MMNFSKTKTAQEILEEARKNYQQKLNADRVQSGSDGPQEASSDGPQEAGEAIPRIPADSILRVQQMSPIECAHEWERFKVVDDSLAEYLKLLSKKVKDHVVEHQHQLMPDGCKSYTFEGTRTQVSVSTTNSYITRNKELLTSAFAEALVAANPLNRDAISTTIDYPKLQNDPDTLALRDQLDVATVSKDTWSIKLLK